MSIDLNQYFFNLINKKWSNNMIDPIMIWMSEIKNWYLFYLILLIFIGYRIKNKIWSWALCLYVNIFSIDQINDLMIKPFFKIIRPCNNPEIKSTLRLLVDQCQQNYSFVSMHAAINSGVFFFYCSRIINY